MRKLFLFLIFGSAILFYACDDARIKEEWTTIEPSGWHKDSVLTFSSVVTDSSQRVNLILGVRNTGNYPFNNLWVMITTTTPDNRVQCDTLDASLANDFGQWHGKGWGRNYTSLLYFRKNIRFPRNGNYTFTVRHGMRRDELKGISNIGFRIETVN
jgi:gliding motility-associated lipoprotein GldH